MRNKSMGKRVVSNSQEVVSSQSSSIEGIFSKKAKRRPSNSNVEIPDDVVWLIFTFLPVKSLFRFSCVCKFCCNLISNSQFAKLHLNHSIKTNRSKYFIHNVNPYPRRLDFDYETLISGKEEIEVKSIADDGSLFGPTTPGKGFSKVWCWGSCNGLLCLLTSPITLIVANPCIRETKTIFCSDSNERRRHDFEPIGGGFGYDIVNDDYKVVKIEPQDLSIDVYSLKKNCWNYRGRFPWKFNPVRFRGTASRYVNGAVHWLSPSHPPLIIAFDLTKEELVNIPAPPYWAANYELNTDGKYLYLTYTLGSQDLRHIYGIWKMETYGVKESWKHISLDFGRPCLCPYISLLSVPDDEVVLLHLAGSFFLYNRKDRSRKWVRIKEIPKHYHISFFCFSHVESLISLGPGSKIVKGLKKRKGRRSRWSRWDQNTIC